MGTGRLGLSFGLALNTAGAVLAGHTSRSADGRARARTLLATPSVPSSAALVASAFGSLPGSPGDVVVFLLTVPDGELPAVAAELAEAVLRYADEETRRNGAKGVERTAQAWAAVHTSGATSVSVLDPCAAAGAVTLSLHPLQTFSDPVRGATLLHGTAMAVTPGPDAARAAEALALGEHLAQTVGGRPFVLPEEHRSLYHAAATVASNYLVTLEDAAERLFRLSGMPQETTLSSFLPLVRGAVDNIEAQGTVGALTGPLSRGDRDTIAAHLSALQTSAPDLVGLYRVLGKATLEIVRRRGELPVTVIESLERTMNVIVERAEDTVTGELTVATRAITFSTQGEGDVIDLTDRLHHLLRESGLTAGTLTVFAPGATGAVTTLEFEPGVVHDFKQLFAKIVPAHEPYRHNLLLSDGNGHSHVRAGLLGPSLVIPFVDARLALGTWQEAVFVCFDNRPRDRKVVVQIMGVSEL
ncbi:MAG: secondary thiamine-phosphate synthase enzyme YjbQ [Thermoleophilia bacterium]